LIQYIGLALFGQLLYIKKMQMIANEFLTQVFIVK
jgi:hypothetical protein